MNVSAHGYGVFGDAIGIVYRVRCGVENFNIKRVATGFSCNVGHKDDDAVDYDSTGVVVGVTILGVIITQYASNFIVARYD